MCHLSVATCQYVSSYWQGNPLCLYCDVPVVAAQMCHQFLLPRCVIFWWLPAKMFHLSLLVGERTVFVLWCTSCCCPDVSSVLAAKMCHLSVATCQDVSSYWLGNALCLYCDVPVVAAQMCHQFLLPRCFIFRWLPAKIFHLIGRGTYCVCIVTYQLLLPRCVTSSCCQDVSSFGGYLPRCFILLVGERTVFVLWYQLLLPGYVISSCYQDVSSFGGYLPRCFILLIGERTVFVLWCTSWCCPDVPSFGGYLQRGFVFGMRTQYVNMLTVAAEMYLLITFSCFRRELNIVILLHMKCISVTVNGSWHMLTVLKWIWETITKGELL